MGDEPERKAGDDVLVSLRRIMRPGKAGLPVPEPEPASPTADAAPATAAPDAEADAEAERAPADRDPVPDPVPAPSAAEPDRAAAVDPEDARRSSGTIEDAPPVAPAETAEPVAGTPVAEASVAGPPPTAVEEETLDDEPLALTDMMIVEDEHAAPEPEGVPLLSDEAADQPRTEPVAPALDRVEDTGAALAPPSPPARPRPPAPSPSQPPAASPAPSFDPFPEPVEDLLDPAASRPAAHGIEPAPGGGFDDFDDPFALDPLDVPAPRAAPPLAVAPTAREVAPFLDEVAVETPASGLGAAVPTPRGDVEDADVVDDDPFAAVMPEPAAKAPDPGGSFDNPDLDGPEPNLFEEPPIALGEAEVESIVRRVLREELIEGELGRAISKNVRRLVATEVARVLAERGRR